MNAATELDTMAQFRARIAALVTLDEIRDDMTLAEIGIDSLNIVELLLSAEELFHVSVDPAALELNGFTTVGDFIVQVSRNAAATAGLQPAAVGG